MFLQECARPLLSDSHMPLYVLSIQERAEQLASQFEGKPVGTQVKFPLYLTFLENSPNFISVEAE